MVSDADEPLSTTQRAICVTGMHRSGTSAVARLVSLLGVDFGRPDAMIAAGDQNPHGFWENARIKQLDEELLELHGGSWAAPPVLPEGWWRSPELASLRSRAAAVLDEELPEGRVAFKDPRMALVLPFWRTVVPVEATIVVLRPPAEVTTSLAQRNGFDPEHAAQLWIRYTTDAWANAGRRILVHYVDLLERPRAVTEELVRELGLSPPPDDVDAAIGSLDPTLRRSQEPPATAGPLLTLAETLHDIVRLAEEPLTEEVFARVRTRWQAAGGELHAAADAARVSSETIRRLEHDLADRRQAYESLAARRSVRAALRLADAWSSLRGERRTGR